MNATAEQTQRIAAVRLELDNLTAILAIDADCIPLPANWTLDMLTMALMTHVGHMADAGSDNGALESLERAESFIRTIRVAAANRVR